MDIYSQIQREVKTLLNKMQFNIVNTPTVQMKDDIFFVNVFIDEPQILIGHQGESLNELQKIIRLIFLKKYQKKINIIIDINGYRRKREQTLKEVALTGRAKALKNKVVINLNKMNPYDRKIIHSTLASFSDISTISKGSGRSRFVSIKPTRY